jgi:hypothetical protein
MHVGAQMHTKHTSCCHCTRQPSPVVAHAVGGLHADACWRSDAHKAHKFFFAPHFSTLFQTWSTVNAQNIFRLRRYLRGREESELLALHPAALARRRFWRDGGRRSPRHQLSASLMRAHERTHARAHTRTRTHTGVIVAGRPQPSPHTPSLASARKRMNARGCQQ